MNTFIAIHPLLRFFNEITIYHDQLYKKQDIPFKYHVISTCSFTCSLLPLLFCSLLCCICVLWQLQSVIVAGFKEKKCAKMTLWLSKAKLLWYKKREAFGPRASQRPAPSWCVTHEDCALSQMQSVTGGNKDFFCGDAWGREEGFKIYVKFMHIQEKKLCCNNSIS